MSLFANFDQEILESKTTALLVFTAAWCKPSRLQKAVIEQLAEEFKSRVRIEIIDVDENDKLAERFNARTLPTTVLLAQGEIIEVLPGFQTLDFLQSYLNHILTEVEKMKQNEKEKKEKVEV
ncbi:MAG: hypothetical protein Kow0029_10470 [Candidatus Rifleibacteriota bacterium]